MVCHITHKHTNKLRSYYIHEMDFRNSQKLQNNALEYAPVKI